MPSQAFRRFACTPDCMERFANYVGQFFLPLVITCSREGKVLSEAFSGFLLLYRRYPFWITAGHVLSGIDEILGGKAAKVHRVAWCDNFEVRAASSIPTDLRRLPRAWVDKDGLDLGIVLLSGHDARLINANKRKQFIDESGCTEPTNWHISGLFLTGSPAQMLTQQESHVVPRFVRVDLRSGSTCLPANPVRSRCVLPDDHFWKYPDAMFARIMDWNHVVHAQPFDSIKGMSGGPVFGMRMRDQACRLVGVQSAWLPKHQMIRATGVQSLLLALDYGIKKMKAAGAPI